MASKIHHPSTAPLNSTKALVTLTKWRKLYDKLHTEGVGNHAEKEKHLTNLGKLEAELCAILSHPDASTDNQYRKFIEEAKNHFDTYKESHGGDYGSTTDEYKTKVQERFDEQKAIRGGIDRKGEFNKAHKVHRKHIERAELHLNKLLGTTPSTSTPITPTLASTTDTHTVELPDGFEAVYVELLNDQNNNGIKTALAREKTKGNIFVLDYIRKHREGEDEFVFTSDIAVYLESYEDAIKVPYTDRVTTKFNDFQSTYLVGITLDPKTIQSLSRKGVSGFVRFLDENNLLIDEYLEQKVLHPKLSDPEIFELCVKQAYIHYVSYESFGYITESADDISIAFANSQRDRNNANLSQRQKDLEARKNFLMNKHDWNGTDRYKKGSSKDTKSNEIFVYWEEFDLFEKKLNLAKTKDPHSDLRKQAIVATPIAVASDMTNGTNTYTTSIKSIDTGYTVTITPVGLSPMVVEISHNFPEQGIAKILSAMESRANASQRAMVVGSVIKTTLIAVIKRRGPITTLDGEVMDIRAGKLVIINAGVVESREENLWTDIQTTSPNDTKQQWVLKRVLQDYMTVMASIVHNEMQYQKALGNIREENLQITTNPNKPTGLQMVQITSKDKKGNNVVKDDPNKIAVLPSIETPKWFVLANQTKTIGKNTVVYKYVVINGVVCTLKQVTKDGGSYRALEGNTMTMKQFLGEKVKQEGLEVTTGTLVQKQLDMYFKDKAGADKKIYISFHGSTYELGPNKSLLRVRTGLDVSRMSTKAGTQDIGFENIGPDGYGVLPFKSGNISILPRHYGLETESADPLTYEAMIEHPEVGPNLLSLMREGYGVEYRTAYTASEPWHKNLIGRGLSTAGSWVAEGVRLGWKSIGRNARRGVRVAAVMVVLIVGGNGVEGARNMSIMSGCNGGGGGSDRDNPALNKGPTVDRTAAQEKANEEAARAAAQVKAEEMEKVQDNNGDSGTVTPQPTPHLKVKGSGSESLEKVQQENTPTAPDPDGD